MRKASNTESGACCNFKHPIECLNLPTLYLLGWPSTLVRFPNYYRPQIKLWNIEILLGTGTPTCNSEWSVWRAKGGVRVIRDAFLNLFSTFVFLSVGLGWGWYAKERYMNLVLCSLKMVVQKEMMKTGSLSDITIFGNSWGLTTTSKKSLTTDWSVYIDLWVAKWT